jgi:hypothetical protein
MRNWKNPKSNLKKWNDLLNSVFFKPTVPSTLFCPECNKNTVHYFWWRFGNDNRGGNWIWCSTCSIFLHHSSKIPDWWINIENIPPEQLLPEPEWLETNLNKWEPKLLSIINNK